MASRKGEILSIRLPPRVAARLRSTAKRSGRSKTEIVVSALEIQLNEGGPYDPGSFLDAARDLVGCIEAPTDLSSNKRHLVGFGS
jgi:hypothetical protein